MRKKRSKVRQTSLIPCFIEAFSVRQEGLKKIIELVQMPYSGMIIEARKVHMTNPPRMPGYLSETFETLRAVGTQAQLIGVRRASVPERGDGSHMRYFLVPDGRMLSVVGVTI